MANLIALGIIGYTIATVVLIQFEYGRWPVFDDA